MYVIIDGNNLAHRTWHTPPVNSELVDGSIELTFQLFLHSFVSALANVINRVDRYRPKFTKVIVCWDGSRAVDLRRQVFPDYKVQRAKDKEKDKKESLPPEIIQRMRAELRKVAPRFDVCFEEAEGDDLMALLCEILQGEEVCLVTRDRDMYQLVDVRVKILNIFTNELIGLNEVEEYFGVPPSGVVEMKAMMGDSSDGYPGIKGVGPKKALAFYKEGNTVARFPEIDNYRKLAKIPFCKLDTDLILDTLVETDLDSPPDWDNLVEEFGISEYVATRLYMVV